MINLHLYGAMAKAYGNVIELNANTPREAITALGFQIPSYRDYVASRDWHIVVGDFNKKDKTGNAITEEELDLSFNASMDVHLIPVITGSGKAMSFVTGAVLFAVGAVMTYATAGAASPFGTNLMWMGGAMMLGGLVQMTTKIPKAGAVSEPEDKRASFLFNGPINSSAQGTAFARGYGRMLIGATVVSGMLYSERLKV